MLVAQSWCVVINFNKINGSQNTNEPGIGLGFPYQTRNFCTKKKGEGVRRCQFLR